MPYDREGGVWTAARLATSREVTRSGRLRRPITAGHHHRLAQLVPRPPQLVPRPPPRLPPVRPGRTVGERVLADEVRQLEGYLARHMAYERRLEQILGQLTRALRERP